MFIKYVGPALDYSGYGEANRHDLGALNAAGVDFTTQIVHYTRELADYGELGILASEHQDKPGDYTVKILHTTPNVYEQYVEEGKYLIGRVFWETDKLPEDFALGCNFVDEIWTGSEYNKQAIMSAGVTKPIFIIPQAIETNDSVHVPYTVGHENDYKFYSIFEWTERKNPRALLEAYWREFENTPGVSLSIKTYMDNFSESKREELLSIIQGYKDYLGLSSYAPVYLYTSLLNREQMYRFHQTFDCFVSAHRGEGWGIPQMEALSLAKPIISTNCGGIHEYLTHDMNAGLVDYTKVPVNGNRSPMWYSSDQNWANIDIAALRRFMRKVYEDQDGARQVGVAGQQVVYDKFNFATVGAQMKNRLETISAGATI